MKKGIAAAVLMAAGMRLAMYAGLGDEVEKWLAGSDGRIISASLNFELGAPGETPSAENTPSAEVMEFVPAVVTVQPSESPAPEPSPEPTAAGELIEPITEVGVEIDNDTSYEADPSVLLAEGLSQTLKADSPHILIIHTHGSEAYKPDAMDSYEATEDSRTTDTNYNVVRVGDELAKALEGYGLKVIHDREMYDYPSYTGSYTRSAAAIENYLEQYPDIAVVIDLHRDAIGSGDVVYKTVASLEGKNSSQVMLLVGTGENGLTHPGWRENLKLALAMQRAMEAKYPTLARPLALKKERYNQQLTSGSMILEVGSNGNTLQEALCAVRLFAECAGPVLASLVVE